jgi:hypothetical protein
VLRSPHYWFQHHPDVPHTIERLDSGEPFTSTTAVHFRATAYDLRMNLVENTLLGRTLSLRSGRSIASSNQLPQHFDLKESAKPPRLSNQDVISMTALKFIPRGN